ncbi:MULTISPECIES: NUDIX domain-containing protein [unclassified Meiothermus]|uniref:NUDIX domain-containing protein n=1 Tax=unclassified Meiothermus TaxID=370471 RepID=UPI000D7D0521|nr:MULTISPECIES: NUDIX hydrolase [unclassified Meiothermus]PZA06599.1 NUDIX hydrolase [Meiothermus sp. Pnk-1]RYM37702.1 NUDIX hydrolase [Meiothermus sp. PNK-Is4]
MRNRAVCYITRGRSEGLVFEHGDASLEAGLSVVASGIEPGETPAQAAVRESWEEAGLKPENPRFLGSSTLNSPSGRNQPERWYFFWLEAPAATPNAWKWAVLSGEEGAGLAYLQRFVPLGDVRPNWNLEAKLETLRSRLNHEEGL